jgi:hypothetical protein
VGTEFFKGSSTTGDPIIARPFFDVNPDTGLPRQAAELVSYPGLSSGTIRVSAHDYFQSAGVTVRHPLCMGQLCGGTSCGTSCNTSCETSCGTAAGASCGGGGGCGPFCCRVDLLVGYRYYRLSDDVTIAEHIDGLPQGRLRDTSIDVIDSFRARNDFHGVEVGLAVQRYRGPWSFELMAKMALGNNHQVVTIDGRTTITQPGQTTAGVGGLLAQPGTNMGTHVRDEFVVIPQLGFEVGYQVTCRLRAYMGYNLLYWAPVARAGNQISPYVDSARLFQSGRTPVLPFPDYDYHCSNFFAHGINAGLEFRY